MEGLLICYEKCGTCQKAKKWLDGQGIAYVERPIRTQPPTEAPPPQVASGEHHPLLTTVRATPLKEDAAVEELFLLPK